MPNIISTTRLQQGANQVTTEVNESLLILEIEKGAYFKLDEVGKAIWMQLENVVTFDELVKSLLQQFNATEEDIVEETRSFVETLVSKNLVEIKA